MGITEQLARLAASTPYDDIPAAAVVAAKRSLLDYVGCALLGSTRPGPRILRQVIAQQGGAPTATVIGAGERLPAAQAALLNGASGHADDFDDVGGVGGHPSTKLSPTVLALGEALGASGAEVLTAWVMGFEVGDWLSRRLGMDRPFHGTSVFGAPAAAVAAGRLLGLDGERMAMALGIATSQSSGLVHNFGTMTQCFHAGHAAYAGVLAAQLAQAGFTASPDIVEARQGFADCFGGEKCDLANGIQPLGQWYALAATAPGVKAWPACFGIHHALTAVFRLRARASVPPDEIVAVQVTLPSEPGTGPVFYRDATDWLEGKFCLEYTLAAALADGRVDLYTYTDEKVRDPRIRRLMACIAARRDPDVALRSPRLRRHELFAEVT